MRSLPATCLAWALAAAAMFAGAQDRATGMPAQQAAGPGRPVTLLRIDGPIGPATADYIARGLEHAARERAPLVVLQIDTPGGLDKSTRQIVKDILASPVPVAAWVAPSGARAASAGAYIVYASHVAAMAPATNLGAATPVQIGGLPGLPQQPSSPTPGEPEKPTDKPSGKADKPGQSTDKPTADQPGAGKPADDAAGKAGEPTDGTGTARSGADAMTRKIVNDSAAWLRSLAQMRGRNADWAERAVREGASLSASEALSRGVIDYIAADLPALLALADARTVRMGDGGSRTLATQGLAAAAWEPDWRTKLLGIITEPTVAYLLLLLGIYGIYYELTSPGFGVPGVAGSISLLLGMFALQMLPVSYAGVALIVLGFALMLAEALIPSFGALGIGGMIAFVVGSVMLIETDAPGFGIPLGLIVTVAVLNLAFVVIVLRMALKARKRPVVSGSEELVGAAGDVVDVTASGTWARVHSERWRVVSSEPLRVGQRVHVLGRDGLVLRVAPDPAPTLDSMTATP